MRWFAFLALVALVTTGMTALQEKPVEVTPKAIQLRQLEWQRTTLLAMAEAMPEDLYRDKVTPEQRDFAEQLLHAAGFPPMLCEGVIRGTRPAPPDTAAILNSRESMTGFIKAGYDLCAEAIGAWDESDRVALAQGFAGDMIPKAEFFDQAHLHTAFTIGQVVANFRKHGMAPPEFQFF